MPSTPGARPFLSFLTALRTSSRVVRQHLSECRHPHCRQPWLSDATYEVLQDKAAAKLRHDKTQRKRLQGVFKAKAKADRNA